MIDAKTVSELRAMTGAGIVECKKALEEANGDMAAAAELLRKKGIAKAGSKSDRQTSAEVTEKEKEIYAEEFIGSNKPAEMVAKIVEGKLGKWHSEVCLLKQAYIKDEDKTVEDVVKESIAKMGENIQVKRFVRFAMESHTQVPG